MFCKNLMASLKHENNNRELFKSKSDFYIANFAALFNTDHILMLFTLCSFFGLLETLIAYFILMPLITFPILFFQTFIGQFSGNGFISVFRMAPYMKGLPYVILILNIMFLIIRSVIFTRLCGMIFYDYEYVNPLLSVGIGFILWACIAILIILGVNLISKVFYFTVGIFPLTVVCIVIAFGFYPGIANFFHEMNAPSFSTFFNWKLWLAVAVFCIWTFGKTSGVFITLGSYNKFYDNPLKNSIKLLTVDLTINLIGVIACFGIVDYLHYHRFDFQPIPFLNLRIIPKNARYLDLFLEICWTFNDMILGTLANVTAIMDEFTAIKCYKIPFICGFCLLQFFGSFGYILNDDSWLPYLISHAFPAKSALVHLLLVFTILWLYGEKRFRRDYKFMTKKDFSENGFRSMKYLKLLLLLAIAGSYIYSEISRAAFYPQGSTIYVTLQIIFCDVPFVIIPIYGLALFCIGKGQNRSILTENLQQWHPPPPIDPELYKEDFIKPNIEADQEIELVETLDSS